MVSWGKKIIQDFVAPLSAGNLPLSQHYDPTSQYQQNLAEGYLVPTNWGKIGDWVGERNQDWWEGKVGFVSLFLPVCHHPARGIPCPVIPFLHRQVVLLGATRSFQLPPTWVGKDQPLPAASQNAQLCLYLFHRFHTCFQNN